MTPPAEGLAECPLDAGVSALAMKQAIKVSPSSVFQVCTSFLLQSAFEADAPGGPGRILCGVNLKSVPEAANRQTMKEN
jgi:hypothetical protein